MYSELDSFERALQHFGTRVEVIAAMEMANKISTEEAYRLIKEELKSVWNEMEQIEPLTPITESQRKD